MNIEEIREYCISKPFTEETFPFDDVTLVFKVRGKMFMMLPLDEPYFISMKCDPERAIELRERYQGIQGAYHMNKKYWNQVSIKGDIPDKLIKELIDHSFELVVAKLPKALRFEINE